MLSLDWLSHNNDWSHLGLTEMQDEEGTEELRCYPATGWLECVEVLVKTLTVCVVYVVRSLV